MADLGDGEDEIERIVDHKGKKKRWYRVRWVGYSEEHDTWHQLEDLSSAAGALEEYQALSGLSEL